MSEKLKPCPFCGGEAYTTITEEGHFWVARCRDCHAQIMLCNKEWQAIKMWNWRYHNWIKTSERMPEITEDVLVVSDKGEIFVGFIDITDDGVLIWRVCEHFARNRCFKLEKYPYWMPLPEPPEVAE